MNDKDLIKIIARMDDGEAKILKRVEEFGWEDEKVKEWESYLLTLMDKACVMYNKLKGVCE